MKFGEIPVSEAEGAILAHSVKHADGIFKKGRVLTKADIAAIATSHVFAARLDPGDVAENDAAAAIAELAGGTGVTAQAPFTGRANLHAAVHGLAVVDVERVRALNRLDEGLTIATVAPYAVMHQRQMVATVKIIPFSIPRAVLAQALAIIGREPLIRVEAFRHADVGLIITKLPQTKPSLVTKSENAMRERVAALGGGLAQVLVVDHAIGPVRAAIAQLQEGKCHPILVFGASAIVDRGDVIPAAVVAAGGEVVHLGMPVDPGNLMMLGALGPTPVIGVPSCARSPKVNGFDWVLERVMAGLNVTATDIMDMGAGGLLAEIPTRPSPREAKNNAPRVAALVLAAGLSSRMGTNKLLADLHGISLIRRTVESLAADQIIVVTGHDAEKIKAELQGLPVQFIHNPDYAQGLSTSLKCGLAALGPDIDAALICLGDMPLVSKETIRRLIASFSPSDHRSICVPVHNGKRGNPVLWGARHFEAMQSLTGDKGARSLMDECADELVEIELPEAVLLDADTPEALARLRSIPTT